MPKIFSKVVREGEVSNGEIRTRYLFGSFELFERDGGL